MKLNGFGAYRMYLAMKAHFTKESYDYVKYAGKTNASEESFNSRKDRYYFQKLASKYDSESLKNLFIVSLYEKPDAWIGNIANDAKSIERLEKREYYLSHIVDEYQKDIKIIFNDFGFDGGFTSKEGTPGILLLLIGGNISPETFVITDHMLKMSESWDMKNIPTWTHMKFRLDKYQAFITYPRSECLEVFTDNFHNGMREKHLTENQESNT